VKNEKPASVPQLAFWVNAEGIYVGNAPHTLKRKYSFMWKIIFNTVGQHNIKIHLPASSRRR